MSIEEHILEAKELFAERAYSGVELRVKSAERLCELLDVERKTGIPNVGVMESLYGLKIVEKGYIPDDKAHLIDSSGKIVQVFNLTKECARS